MRGQNELDVNLKLQLDLESVREANSNTLISECMNTLETSQIEGVDAENQIQCTAHNDQFP